MRISSILLVAIAAFLASCNAASASDNTKLSMTTQAEAVETVDAAPAKRFLRSKQQYIEDDSDLDDDDDQNDDDDQDEERWAGISIKAMGKTDRALLKSNKVRSNTLKKWLRKGKDPSTLETNGILTQSTIDLYTRLYNLKYGA